MIFTITKCEICESNFRFQPHQRPHERDTPDDWFTLFQGNIVGREGWHFCSGGCLSMWISERVVSQAIGTMASEA